MGARAITILLDIGGVMALGYGGLLVAIYTGYPRLCAACSLLLMAALVYFSF